MTLAEANAAILAVFGCGPEDLLDQWVRIPMPMRAGVDTRRVQFVGLAPARPATEFVESDWIAVLRPHPGFVDLYLVPVSALSKDTEDPP